MTDIDTDKLRALIDNLRSVKRPSKVILLNPHGPEAADAILAMAEENKRLKRDVQFWKGIAAERSEQMQQLNLDRAAIGVENMRLREALGEIVSDFDDVSSSAANPRNLAVEHQNIARRALGKEPKA
ncbi:hypothetical protein [Novosphingobium lindaniclasticum]